MAEPVVVRRHDLVVEMLLSRQVAIQPPDGSMARSWFPDTPLSRMLLRMGDRAIAGDGNHAKERDRRRDFIRGMLDRESVRDLVPDVRSVADELVGGLLAAGPPADLAADYAEPFCARSACLLLGVPAADAVLFADWAAAKESTDYRRAALAFRDMSRYVNALIARAAAEPGHDVVSHLLAVSEGSEAERYACAAEIAHWIISLGWQVPAAAVSHGLCLLLTHPRQRHRLAEEPELLDAAVEEVLRLFDFIPADRGGVDRFATRDMEVGGCPVHAGDMLVLDISAANRDPAVFERPAEFDVGRTPNPHLTFGRGAYYCHFSQTARQEVRTAIEVALRRLPGLRLSGPEAATVTWDDATKESA